jgi:hypothetical protein
VVLAVVLLGVGALGAFGLAREMDRQARANARPFPTELFQRIGGIEPRPETHQRPRNLAFRYAAEHDYAPIVAAIPKVEAWLESGDHAGVDPLDVEALRGWVAVFDQTEPAPSWLLRFAEGSPKAMLVILGSVCLLGLLAAAWAALSAVRIGRDAARTSAGADAGA